MYFEAKADTGALQLDDSTKLHQLVYARRQKFRPVEQNPNIRYGITGEEVKKRTVYYIYPLDGLEYENKFVFWRNPTNVPMHIFPSTFNIYISNLYSTVFYPHPFVRNNGIAVTNCSEDDVKNVECYVFDYSDRVRSCSVGIEIRNANNEVIFNSAKGNRPLKLLKMGQFKHCEYGSESSRGTDLEASYSFDKEIAINIGYRGLYNYQPPSGNAATINYDARFPVPILTHNSLTFKTCYDNNFCNYRDWNGTASEGNPAGFYGIMYEGYYDENGQQSFGYNSDRYTILSGAMPCNKTTFAVVDVTGYYDGGAFIY